MGFFIVFKCNERQLKSEMFTQLKSGSFHGTTTLIRIIHPERDKHFNRLEKTEFTYFGRLYDVVVERKSGDTTLFYCLHDIREETLLADFTLFLSHSGNNGNPHSGIPFQSLISNLITQALVQTSLLQLPDNGLAFSYPEFSLKTLPAYILHSSPPPKMA